MQIGIDIVEVSRIKNALEKPKFKENIFTEKEIQYCESKKNKFESYAGRFASKEALAKALGTGFNNLSFLDIEILNDELGKPYIKYKDYEINLSISHEKNYAVAVVLIK